MKGNITKKSFFGIWKVIGFLTAIKILFSLEPVALQILVKGIK